MIVVMKRILVIAVVTAVSLLNAYAQRKAPVSDPENNIYVGSADTSNPLDMYNEAVMDAFYEFYNVQKAFVDGQVNAVTVHSVETNAQNQTPGDMSSSTLIGMCDIKLLKSEILYDSVFFVWLEIIPDGDDYMYEIQSDVSGMRSTMKDSSSGKEVIDENMQAKFNVALSRSSKDPVNWQSIRIIDSRFRQRGDDITEDYRTVLRTVTDTDTSVGLSSTR